MSEQAIITVMCMIYEDNKILLQHRVNRNWNGITFPGGHVEYKESIVEACIREMKEETGLDVSNLILCGVKQFQNDLDERYISFLFKTNTFKGTLTSSDEGKMEWFDRNDLDKVSGLVDDFMELLSVFDTNNYLEFYYERNEKNDWKVKIY